MKNSTQFGGAGQLHGNGIVMNAGTASQFIFNDALDQSQVQVSSLDTARMVAQIRVKQNATHQAYQKLAEIIRTKLENVYDITHEELVEKVNQSLDSVKQEFIDFQKNAISSKGALDKLWFPIYFNKGLEQVSLAEQYIQKEYASKEKKDEMLNDLIQGKWMNCDERLDDRLPFLGSKPESNMYGNHNASVKTMLLYNIAHELADHDLDKKASDAHGALDGAMTFYPYHDVTYVYDKPGLFAKSNGMLLVGDYQFGAHRYFLETTQNLGQSLLKPEDCSSALVKATGVKFPILHVLKVSDLKQSYQDHKKIISEGCVAEYDNVTSNLPQERLDYEKIAPGMVWARNNHCGIVLDYNSKGELYTVSFNRDISSDDVYASGKRCGGGIEYRLAGSDAVSEDGKNADFFFKTKSASLKENIALTNLLERIDNAYKSASPEQFEYNVDHHDYGVVLGDLLPGADE